MANFYFFIWIHGWRLMAGSATFGLMARVVVLIVGDICKLVTETIQFGLGSILVNFVLPGNLRNTITWYQLDVAQWTTISHLEHVSSGSVHAEHWHVLRIWGGWGVGMIMRLWNFSHPFLGTYEVVQFLELGNPGIPGIAWILLDKQGTKGNDWPQVPVNNDECPQIHTMTHHPHHQMMMRTTMRSTHAPWHTKTQYFTLPPIVQSDSLDSVGLWWIFVVFCAFLTEK